MYALDTNQSRIQTEIQVVQRNATDFVLVLHSINERPSVWKKCQSNSSAELNSTDAWSESATLSEGRCYAGCAYSDEHGLVISGGVGRPAVEAKDSIENTLDGEAFNDSIPHMPKKVYSHCFVALESGDMLAAGGFYYKFSRPQQFTITGETYVYTQKSAVWVRLPDMPTPRCDHMCGLITTKTGSQEVVAAGGRNLRFLSSDFDVVEIYSFYMGKWRQGK